MVCTLGLRQWQSREERLFPKKGLRRLAFRTLWSRHAQRPWLAHLLPALIDSTSLRSLVTAHGRPFSVAQKGGPG